VGTFCVNSLSADTVLAERIRSSLARLPTKFAELGEGGELSRVFRTPHDLRGPKIGQAPEDFTEQYLIEPVLDALGYHNPLRDDFIPDSPQFVRRPTTFSSVEPNKPDYLLDNVDSSLVAIVEAKAINREQPDGTKRYAKHDIEAYLDDDTLSKYLHEIDLQYLVGIGTDGLRWTLCHKRLGQTDRVIDDPLVDLSRVIADQARRDGVIEGEPAHGVRENREFLAENFVPYFTARHLPTHVRQQYEDK
jgi:hypothetical protein